MMNKYIKILSVLIAILIADQGEAISKLQRNQSNVDVVKRKRTKKVSGKAKIQISRAQIYAETVEKKLLSGLGKTIGYLEKQAKRQRKRSPSRMQFLQKGLQLRLEYAILQRNQEEKTYDKQYSIWEAKGAKGRAPKLNARRSTALWKTVASKAGSLLKEYPRSKNADKTTYQRAFAFEFLGKRKEAARIYSQLVKRFPNSTTAGEAYFSLGEYYFDKNDFRNAMNNYKKAIKFKRAKRYGWSVFKLGWCYYNLGQYRTAVVYWKKVVSYSRTQGNKGLRLKEEAMRDMVYAFAELKTVNSAISYYRANGGRKYIGGLLQLLAQTFANQGQFKSAIKVAKKYQSIEPNAPKGPEMQKFVIELFNDLGSKSMVWKELAAFGTKYGPRSSWYRANSKDKRLVLETQQLIKDQMLYYAKITHKAAQDDKSRTGFLQAMRGYDLFLKTYPKSKEVAEIQFNKADILYFLKKYRDSGLIYLSIGNMGKKRAMIYDSKSGKPTSIHLKSAKFMLDAFGKDYEKEFKVAIKKKPNFKKRARPISRKGKSYIKACLQYIKWYPKDSKTTFTCELDITKIYYSSGNKKLSKKYLNLIATKYPKKKEGAQSVEQLIPLYADNPAELTKVVNGFLKIPQYSRGKLGAKLKDLKRKTEIDSIVKEKDTAKRAKAYEIAAIKNPKAKDADLLHYNAAIDYTKAGQIANAVRNYKKIYKQYPKSAQMKDVLIKLSQISEKQLKFREAIRYYGDFAKKFPKDKLAVAAKSKQCELSSAEGGASAWVFCAELARTEPATARSYADGMLFAYQLKGDASKLRTYTSKYVSQFKPSLSEKTSALARLYAVDPSRRSETKLLTAYKQSPSKVEGPGLRAVAGIYYKKSFPAVGRFSRLKLKGGTVDALAASIQRKIAGLKKLTDSFKTVFNTRDAYWGVAALHQIGKAHIDFAELIENPPAIKGAKAEDVKKQLAPQAVELRKIAMKDFFKPAASSVEKLNIYSVDAANLVASMAAAEGAKISFDEYVPRPDYIGAEIPRSIKNSL